MPSQRYKLWLLTGALLGGLAVAFGAFGAHGLRDEFLKDAASPNELTAAEFRLLENWETAARYAMYHGLALLAVGLLAARRRGLAIHLAGTAMTLGTLIFSGSLFALVLTEQRWLGAVVPIGGTLLIVGWICLLVAFWNDRPAEGKAAE